MRDTCLTILSLFICTISLRYISTIWSQYIRTILTIIYQSSVVWAHYHSQYLKHLSTCTVHQHNVNHNASAQCHRQSYQWFVVKEQHIQLEYVLYFWNFQNWLNNENRGLMKRKANSPIYKASQWARWQNVSWSLSRWNKAAQSVKVRLTPGCAERRGNKGSIVPPQMFPGKLRHVQYLPPFLVTQFTRRRHYNTLFSIPPPTFWSQKEALLYLLAKIGYQYHWHGLRENTIQMVKTAKQRREKVSNTEGIVIWPELTTACNELTILFLMLISRHVG